jgi:hypothetical protein
VAALHPALALLVDDGGDRTDRPFLVETARSLGRIADWAYLRRAVGEGRYPWLGVDPGAARWMDDGMFARTVVASSPALGELRAALTTAVSEPVLEQVDAALAAWGLVDAPRQTFKTHPPSADEHDGPDWGGGYPTGAVDEDEEAAAGSVR